MWIRFDLADRSRRNEFTALRSRTGPEINHIIRRRDGILVMLHHDDRIPKVAQFPQRRQQPVVVPLMQPDARLIEHIEHAAEPRP